MGMGTPYPITTHSRGAMTGLQKARGDKNPEAHFLGGYCTPGLVLEDPDCSIYVELMAVGGHRRSSAVGLQLCFR